MSHKKKKKNTKSNKKVVSARKFINNIIYLLIIVLASIFIYFCVQISFIQDDAYISFRYVRNFVNGNGLVFNIGENVEGFTNFLWIIILSIFAIAKVNLENTAQYLSVGFGVLSIIVTFKLSQTLQLNFLDLKEKHSDLFKKLQLYADIIPCILLVFTGAFSYWAVSGLETSLFTFLFLLGLYFYIKSKKSHSIHMERMPVFIFSLPPERLITSCLHV